MTDDGTRALTGDRSQAVPSVCAKARAAARSRLGQLVKPPGSLGRLEQFIVDLAGLQATPRVTVHPASYILFAADHGVTAQGVSPYPQSITAKMVEQIAAGRAASSVLAAQHGMRLEVVDVGVVADCAFPGVVVDKSNRGTNDFSKTTAMSGSGLDHALAAGARAVDRAVDQTVSAGSRLIVLGEMGIGNTTAASALLAALRPDLAATDTVGPGTGHDAAGIARKADVIAAAMTKHGLRGQTDSISLRQMLTCVGGFEIAALSGAMQRAAACRCPVLVDGFIATVAAALAIKQTPDAAPYLIATHKSAEPGHRFALELLETEPLLDLQMRLGEGTGAAIAYGLLKDAVALYNTMATFAEAGIGGGESDTTNEGRGSSGA
ncbi:MAG: nicotinate-nucleotide--dimethylbenzimidazole phosphoribosyltransferase [Pseudomonadota bacterium]